MMIGVKAVAAMLLFGPLIYAAISDLRAMVIPNWVSLSIAAGFGLFVLAQWPNMDLSAHFIIAGILFAITYAFWWAGWLGGGDVKLLTVTGLWAGPAYMFSFVILLAVFSIALALFLIAVRAGSRSGTAPPPASAARRRAVEIANTGACPYGIPIALAGFATFPNLFM